MTMYVFYRRDRVPGPAVIIDEFDVEIWRPSWTAMRPSDWEGKRWVVWWLFDRTRVFRRRWYRVFTLRGSDGQIVHRSCLFPKFFRFPTVAHDEMQIGDVWTHPDFRGRGLTKLAIARLLAEVDDAARGIWYITESKNAASQAVARAAGFTLAGVGRRENRLGIGLLGRYVLAEGPQNG